MSDDSNTLLFVGLGAVLVGAAAWISSSSGTAAKSAPVTKTGGGGFAPGGACSPAPGPDTLITYGPATPGRSLRDIGAAITGHPRGSDDDVVAIAQANPNLAMRWLYDISLPTGGTTRWVNPTPWGGDWSNVSSPTRVLVDVLLVGEDGTFVRVPLPWYLYFTKTPNGQYLPDGKGTKFPPCATKVGA